MGSASPGSASAARGDCGLAFGFVDKGDSRGKGSAGQRRKGSELAVEKKLIQDAGASLIKEGLGL
jgi:hypothetical protein